jgi:serine/threonine-protein kinase RsbW
VLKSCIGDLQGVRVFVQPLLAELPISDKERANIEFSLIEAVINAMNHGNGSDPSKTVNIVFEAGPDKVTLRVSDSGPGFDPDKIENPRDPSMLTSTSGRGIFFMRQMMSSVKFDISPAGTTVILEKHFNRV